MLENRTRTRIAVALVSMVMLASCSTPGGGGEDSAEPQVSDPQVSDPQASEPEGADRELSVAELPDGFSASPSDLISTSPDGLVFVSNSGAIEAVHLGEEGLTVVDVTEALVGEDELAPINGPITTCGSVVAASVVTSDGAVLRSVDAVSAELLWERPVIEGDGGSDEMSPLACTAGTVIALTDDLLVAIDAQDGSTRWTAALMSDDPPFAAGDLVAAGTYDGVVGLDVDTGEERWRVAGGSDAVGDISEHGVTIDLADKSIVIAPDGSELGELTEDRLGGLVDSGLVSVNELLLGGPLDGPVLFKPNGNRYIDLEGQISELNVDGEPVEKIVGRSGDLLWVGFYRGDDRVTALVDLDGRIEHELVMPGGGSASLATDRIALGDSGAVVFG